MREAVGDVMIAVMLAFPHTVRLAAMTIVSLTVLLFAAEARAVVLDARVGPVRLAPSASAVDPVRVLSGVGALRQGGTLSLAVSPGQPVFGQSADLIATVSNAPQVSGGVQFALDGVAVGGVRGVEANGVAKATTDPLRVGEHTARASYSGAAGAGVVEGRFTVVQADSATTFAPPPTTVAGQPVTYAAFVGAEPPATGAPGGGVVQFVDGGGPVGAPAPVGADGSAQVTAAPAAGAHRLQAVYSGDANFKGSTGITTHQVNRADTVVRITTTPAPVAAGSDLAVRVSVNVLPPGSVPAGGSLQASLDGRPTGGPTAVPATGTVALTLRPTGTARTATLAVAYSGDANTNPSSASLRQTITDPSAGEGTPPGGAPPEEPGAAEAVDAALLSDMTAPLLAALRTRGLAALGRTVQRLQTPQAGLLKQRVLARAAESRQAPLASGRRRVVRAGTARLRLHVTAAARRLTPSDRAVRLVIVTRFTPTRGRPVTITQRITVRPRRGTAARTGSRRTDASTGPQSTALRG
jgi:hypothetical protein